MKIKVSIYNFSYLILNTSKVKYGKIKYTIIEEDDGDREFVNNCSSLYVDLPSCNIFQPFLHGMVYLNLQFSFRLNFPSLLYKVRTFLLEISSQNITYIIKDCLLGHCDSWMLFIITKYYIYIA